MNISKSLAAAGIIALAGIGAARAEETTVKFQDYPGTGNTLFRMAAAKGYCEKHGIKCVFQTIPAAPLGVQALLAGSIDVAYAPPEVVINASLKGAALKAIATGAQDNVIEIVARNGLDIPDGDKDFKGMMAALRGKKIGVPARGSAAELIFGFIAEKAGEKAGDYTYVAVGGPVTSTGSLKSGQIDASVTYEPSGSICDVTKECKSLYRAATAKEPKEISGTNGAAVVYVVTQAMIDKSPKLIDAIIAAAKDAEAFAQNPANFPEALKITKSYFELKMPHGAEILEYSLKRSILAQRPHISLDAMKQIAANMLATKQIAEPFDTSKIIYDKAP